jgi:molybdenum cofactor biosynthesis enzyme MoaA
MSATTKGSLKARLAELTASVEALPEDVFSDVIARNQVQSQLANFKAAVDTPLESIFEMCFQVCICRPRLYNPSG